MQDVGADLVSALFVPSVRNVPIWAECRAECRATVQGRHKVCPYEYHMLCGTMRAALIPLLGGVAGEA